MEKVPPTVTNESVNNLQQEDTCTHLYLPLGAWWVLTTEGRECEGGGVSFNNKLQWSGQRRRQTNWWGKTGSADRDTWGGGTLSKLLWVLNNPQRPLHHILDRQWSVSSQTLRQLHCLTDRYREHFLPPAAKLLKAPALTWQMAVEVLQFIFVFV